MCSRRALSSSRSRERKLSPSSLPAPFQEHAFFAPLALADGGFASLSHVPPPEPHVVAALLEAGALDGGELEEYSDEGLRSEWLLEGEATPIELAPIEAARDGGADRAAGAAAEGLGGWEQFVREGESVVRSGDVLKRVGLFSRRRRLVLTDAPRLVYIDLEARAGARALSTRAGARASS